MSINIGSKRYADKNDPKTCKASQVLGIDKIMVVKGDYELAPLNTTAAGVLIINAKGEADYVRVPDGESGHNLVLKTNDKGALSWQERRQT